ncbi:M15 family metallopeptidase [Cellulosimicrobium cellulans]|uniref:M15 family metallopeptidase n=1 Tax=Cellulosimicrobium cellulans TaxID=1710 RepID=UPI00130E7A79|nr:M15 family metallopeptidase [Cellulosimicrobium cellulans]
MILAPLSSDVVLLSDDRVRSVPARECGEPLVDLTAYGVATRSGTGRTAHLVRDSLAQRLARADAALRHGLRLLVVEGHRALTAQRAIIAAYSACVAEEHPNATAEELTRLVSRFVAPADQAPHVAGAAVDVTLTDPGGRPVPMGTEIDATPEQSAGACAFDFPGIDERARANRAELARVLGGEGLVNYPTEWWHWSYGDRYWAFVTGAGHAVFEMMPSASSRPGVSTPGIRGEGR